MIKGLDSLSTDTDPEKGLKRKRGPREKMDSEDDAKRKHIHVILSSSRFEKFKSLKKALEQNSDVDVVRICIDEVYKSLNEEKINLREILEKQVNLLLDNDYLKERYFVLTLNDVVNEAVHQWLQNKKGEINLHHFPFRQHLSEIEQQIALTIVEKQFNYDRGLSFEDLKKHVEGVEDSKIRGILKKFIDNGLILTSQVQGVNYYYAPVP